MCGICGFSGLRDDALLRAMTAALIHRGPDEDGFFSDGEAVSLGMRRLKIIDLSTGSQPVSNEDGSVTVVFNGEIYNFRELRRDLEAAGHRFKTKTDTEVLVHLYEAHGEGFPSRLRGMFAFALWDSKERRLLLGRDQFGIKPLYYAVSGGKLYFASELKGLRRVAGLAASLDPQAVDLYFTYLYIPAPFTVYKDIKKLEPASLLVFKGGEARVKKYWRLEPPGLGGKKDGFLAEKLRELLSASVKEQLVSDVPLGLLLSGGMDSVSILSFMAEHAGRGVKTFTAGFPGEDSGFDETSAARAAALHFGAAHREVPLRPEIGPVIKELAAHFDEPFADSSALANYLVTREARRHVTVALAGIGGDELFAGYPRHLGARLLPAYLKTPAFMRRLAAGAASLVPESRSAFNLPGRFKRFFAGATSDFPGAYNSWISYLAPGEKAGFYSGEFLAAVSGAAPARLAGLPADPDAIFGFELGSYLPDDLLCLADRASMANSLELRVPFLDTRLVEFLSGVPLAVKTRGFGLKHLLKRAMADRLPPGVLNAPKRGFQVPLARWQEGGLKDFTAEALSPEKLKSAGVLSPEGVKAMLYEHARGRRNLYDRVHAALVFQLWFEQARAGPSPCFKSAWNVERDPGPGGRKILFVNLAGLGDIVMMTPAVRAVRAACPGARLELLTIERSRGLAEGLGAFDKIHAVPIRYRMPGPAAFFRFLGTLLALRREKFDALVNFSLVSSRGGFLKARFINLVIKPALASCRALAGFGRPCAITFIEEPVEKKSEVELTSRLLAPLGVQVWDLNISYAAGLEEKKKVSMDLAARGLTGSPVFGLNPGAFRPSRRWGIEKWKELVRLILERYPGALVMVTGGSGERTLAEELKISERVFAAAGLYTVRETAALYCLMDVFITNDTGPMHLAAAAGVKVAAIFGPGDVWRFSPSVDPSRKRIIRRETPGCEPPCYKFSCEKPACLDSISPEEVLLSAEELLGKRK